jgi:hypothetical protein
MEFDNQATDKLLEGFMVQFNKNCFGLKPVNQTVPIDNGERLVLLPYQSISVQKKNLNLLGEGILRLFSCDVNASFLSFFPCCAVPVGSTKVATITLVQDASMVTQGPMQLQIAIKCNLGVLYMASQIPPEAAVLLNAI